MLETPGLVAGIHNVAVMREPVKQCGGHLGIAEHAGPLGERQVRGDHDAGVLVELGEQVDRSAPPAWENGR